MRRHHLCSNNGPLEKLTDTVLVFDVPWLMRGAGNEGLLPRIDGRLDIEYLIHQGRLGRQLHSLSVPPLQPMRATYRMRPLLRSRSLKSLSLNTASRYPRSFFLSAPHNMHRKVTIDTSPPPARWMKETLDRSAFHRTVPVVAARLPAVKAGPVVKAEPMRG
jgi:hypothetical protein